MVFIGSAQQQFLLSLLCSVMSQGCKTSLWKRKSTPGVLGLWLLKDELGATCPMLPHTHKRLSDVEYASFPVNVLPPESQQLPTTEPHPERREESCIEAMPLETTAKSAG